MGTYERYEGGLFENKKKKPQRQTLNLKRLLETEMGDREGRRESSVIGPEITSVCFISLTALWISHCASAQVINTQARGLTYKIGLIVGGARPVFHWAGSACDGWGEPQPYFSHRLVPGMVLKFRSRDKPESTGKGGTGYSGIECQQNHCYSALY